MVIAGIADAESGGNIANLMFSLCLIFCGVLAPPTSLPGFWIFMYRVSPFTYLVNGMLATGVANQEVTCAANEFVHFSPPSGQTCLEYLQPYISQAGGYLQDDNATSDCGFCTYADTNVFLEAVSSRYSQRYRNFGILWAFIIVNIFLAVFFYWLARVPKTKGKKKEKTT
jgi:ATP-binding cassette subfamily G (WHITE) protein 2 (PDR)